ncbi:MAG: lipopolysaccharide biosynthesis protein [Firmicutes bacterium]|nr:lipopolysaccharide biosynthesis protein [Bacillota bacterium]
MGSDRLGKKTAVGFIWALSQTVAGRVINIAGHILLAWLLAPTDFGLISLAYTALVFGSVLQRAGLNYVLVQRQATLSEWQDAGLWLGFAFGLIATLLLVAAAPLISSLYDEPALLGLILLLSAVPLLDGLAVVPNARLQVDLRFRAIAIVNFAYTATHIVVAVLLAWRGMGAYAFIVGHVAAIALRSILFWFIAPVAVRFQLGIAKWPSMIRDGAKLVLSGLCTNLMFQADYIVLGILHSSTSVGLYYFAYRLSTQSIQLISTSLSNVLFPAFSKLQEDKGRQYAAFLKSASLLVYIVTPICFIQAAIVPPGIRLIFESKWYPSIPMLQILCIGMAFRVLYPISNSMLRACGRFTLHMVLSMISAGIFISAVTSMAFIGDGVYVAIGASAAFAILGPGILHQAFLSVGGSFMDVCRVLFRPVLCSIAAMIIAMLASQYMHQLGLSSAGNLSLTFLAGASAYLLASCCLMRRQQVELIRVCAQLIKRQRPHEN